MQETLTDHNRIVKIEDRSNHKILTEVFYEPDGTQHEVRVAYNWWENEASVIHKKDGQVSQVFLGTRDELCAVLRSMVEGVEQICYPKYAEPIEPPKKVRFLDRWFRKQEENMDYDDPCL